MPRGPRNAALLAALEEVQGAGAKLAIGEAGPDVTGLTWIRAAVAGDAELIRVGWRVKATAADVQLACRVMGRLAAPTSAATEKAVLDALQQFVDRALQAYPSTLQHDQLELLQPEGVAWLRRQVLQALISEKQALTQTLQLVQSTQQAVASGSGPLDHLYDAWGHHHFDDDVDSE